jgi:hypothetical protein
MKLWKKPHDQRRSPRIPGGDLVAYYWNGGAPSPRKVSNVSPDGAYIEAPDKWYPGTVVTLIFQLASAHPPNPNEAAPTGCSSLSPCAIRAVVIRSAQDGFGVEFLFVNHDERSGFQQFLREAVGTPPPSETSLPANRRAAAGSS